MKSCGLFVILIVGMKLLTVTASCQHGWETFQTSCYIYISQDLAYYDALTICNKEGYDLLEVTSEAENKFITDLVTAKRIASVWLGINDLFNKSQWVYSSTGLPISFNKLDPARAGQEHCMQLAADGTWSNQFCGKSNFFFCKMAQQN